MASVLLPGAISLPKESKKKRPRPPRFPSWEWNVFLRSEGVWPVPLRHTRAEGSVVTMASLQLFWVKSGLFSTIVKLVEGVPPHSLPTERGARITLHPLPRHGRVIPS